MGDLAVIALEVVLAADLPVGRVLTLVAAQEAKVLDVDSARREQVGQRRSTSCSAGASESGLTKTNGPPRGDAERHEAEAVGGEARLSLGARGGAKRPVEVVRPGVVRAPQRLAAALALADERAAVPADIEEGAQHPLGPGRAVPERLRHERPRTGRARRAGHGARRIASAAGKTRSCSVASTAGSTYQLQGSVCGLAAASTPRA